MHDSLTMAKIVWHIIMCWFEWKEIDKGRLLKHVTLTLFLVHIYGKNNLKKNITF